MRGRHGLRARTTLVRLGAGLGLGTAWTLLLAACAPPGAESPGFAVYDSAGVTIAHNGREPGDDREWRVSAEPLLTIGVVHGDEPYQLWDVRAAVRLRNGGMVIANAGTRELRYYDGRGRFVASAGREGGGPGEFRALTWLFQYRGDSVIAFDLGSRQLSVFGPNGGFGRTVTLSQPPDEAATVLPRGAALDGALFGVSADPIVPSDPPRVHRPLQRLYRFNAGGGEPVLIGRFPGALRYQGRGTALGLVSFTGRSLYDVRDNWLFVVMTDTFAIQVRSLDGILRRLVRFAWQPIPVTDEHIALERRQQLEEWGDRYARLPPQMMEGKRTLMEVMPFPSSFPAIDTIALGGGGAFWVRRYVPIGSPKTPERWMVFDVTGYFSGAVELPAGLTLLDFGSDYLIGVMRDDLGVESVRLYSIERR